MANTGRILLEATVTDVGIGPFVYPACGQCYSKLVFVSGQDCQFHRCQNCGRSYSYGQFRYRLCLTVTDGTAVASLTSFGGMLNSFFGIPATQFHMLMSSAEAKYRTSYASIMQVAIEQAFVGQRLLFGLKTTLTATKQKYSKHPNTDSALTLRDICQSANTLSQKSVGGHSPDLIAVQIMPVTDSSFSATVVDCLQNLETMIEASGLTLDAITDRTVLLQMLSLCRLGRGNRSSSISSSFMRQTNQSLSGSLTRHVSQLPAADTSCNATVDSSFDQSSLAFSCDDSPDTIFVPGKARLTICANHDPELAVCLPRLDVSSVDHGNKLRSPWEHEESVKCYPFCHEDENRNSEVRNCLTLQQTSSSEGILKKRQCELAGAHKCEPRNSGDFVKSKLYCECKNLPETVCGQVNVNVSELKIVDGQCEIHKIKKMGSRSAVIKCHHGAVLKHTVETACFQNEEGRHDVKTLCGQSDEGKDIVKNVCDLGKRSDRTLCVQSNVDRHNKKTVCSQSDVNRQNAKTVHGQSGFNRHKMKTVCKQKDTSRLSCVCTLTGGKLQHSYFQEDCTAKDIITLENKENVSQDFHTIATPCHNWQPKQRPAASSHCDLSIPYSSLAVKKVLACKRKRLKKKLIETHGFCVGDSSSQRTEKLAATYCPLKVKDRELEICGLSDSHTGLNLTADSSGQSQQKVHSKHRRLRLVHSDQNTVDATLSSEMSYNLNSNTDKKCKLQKYTKKISAAGSLPQITDFEDIPIEFMEESASHVTEEYLSQSVGGASSKFEDYPESEGLDIFLSKIREENPSKGMAGAPSQVWEDYFELERLDVSLSLLREDNPSQLSDENHSKLQEDNPSQLSDKNPSKLQEDSPSQLREDNPSALLRNAQSYLRSNIPECESLHTFLPELKEDNTLELMEDYPSELMEDYLESDELEAFFPPIGAGDLSNLTEDVSSTLLEGYPESEGFDAFMSKLREDTISKLREESTSKLRENNTSELIENTSELRASKLRQDNNTSESMKEYPKSEDHDFHLLSLRRDKASQLRDSCPTVLRGEYHSELMGDYPGSAGLTISLTELNSSTADCSNLQSQSITTEKSGNGLLTEKLIINFINSTDYRKIINSVPSCLMLRCEKVDKAESDTSTTILPSVDLVDPDDLNQAKKQALFQILKDSQKHSTFQNDKSYKVIGTFPEITPLQERGVTLGYKTMFTQGMQQDIQSLRDRRTSKDIQSLRNHNTYQDMHSPKNRRTSQDIHSLRNHNISQDINSLKNHRASEDIQSLKNHRTSEDIQSLKNHRTSKDIQSLKNHRTSEDIQSLKNHRTSQDIISLKNHRTSEDIQSLKNHRTSQDIHSLRNQNISQDINSLKNHRTSQDIQSLKNHRTSQDIHYLRNQNVSQDINPLKNHKTSEDIHSLKNHRTSQDIQSLRNDSTSQGGHSLKSHKRCQDIHFLRSQGLSDDIKIVQKRDAAKNIKPFLKQDASKNVKSFAKQGVSDDIKIVQKRDAAKNIKPLLKQNASKNVKSFAKQDVPKTDKNTEKQTLFQAVKACHRTSKDVKDVQKHKLSTSVKSLQAKIVFENHEKPNKTSALNTPFKVADSQVCNDSEKLFSSKTVGSLSEQTLFPTIENPHIQASFHIVTNTEKEMSLRNVRHSADQTLTQEAVNSVKTSNRYEIEKNSENQALVGKATNRKKHVLKNSTQDQEKNTLPQLNINGKKRTFLQRGKGLGRQPDTSSVTIQIMSPSQQTIPKSKKQVFSLNCTTPKQVQHFKTPAKSHLLSDYTTVKTPQPNGKMKQSLNSTNIRQQTSLKVKCSTGNILRNCKDVREKVYLNYATPKENLQQNIENSKKMLSSNYATPKANMKNSNKILTSNYATPKEHLQQNTITSKKTLSSNYATPRQPLYKKNQPSSEKYVSNVSGTTSESHISLAENINAQNSNVTRNYKSTGKGVLELTENTSVTEYGGLSIDLHAMSMNVTLRRSKRKYHTDKLDDKSSMNLFGCEQASTEILCNDRVNDDTCALAERPPGKLSRLSDLDCCSPSENLCCSSSEDLFQATDGSFVVGSCFYEGNSDKSFQRDSSSMCDRNLQKARIVQNDSRSRHDRPESSSDFQKDSIRLSESNVEKDSPSISDKSALKDSTGLSHSNVQKDSTGLSHSNVQKDITGLFQSSVQKDNPSFSHSNVQKDSPSLSHINVKKDSLSLSHSNVQKDIDSLSRSNVQKDSTGLSQSSVQKDNPSISHNNVQKDNPSFSHNNVQKDSPNLSHINVKKYSPSLSHSNVQKDIDSLSHSNVQKDSPSLSHSNVQKDIDSLSHSNVQKDSPSLSHSNVQKDIDSLSHNNVQEKDKFGNWQHACSTSGDCNTEIMDVNNKITKITDVNVHAGEIIGMNVLKDRQVVEILNVNDSVTEITDFGDSLAQISEINNEVTESTDVNNKVTKITDMCNHMTKFTDMYNHITEIIATNNIVAEITDKPDIITETLLNDSGCSEVLWDCTDCDVSNSSSLRDMDIRSQNISSIEQFDLVVAQLSCENSERYNNYEHTSPLPGDSSEPLIYDTCPNRDNGKSLIYDMESVKASVDSGLSQKRLQPSEAAFSSQAVTYLSPDVDQGLSSNVGQVLSDSLSDLFSSQDEDSKFVLDTSHNNEFGKETCRDVVQKTLLVAKSNMVSVRLDERFSELKHSTSVNGQCQRSECESVVSKPLLLLHETNPASDKCEHSFSKVQLRNFPIREQVTKQVRFSDKNVEHSYFTFETISHLPVVNKDMYHLKSSLKKDSTDWDPAGSQDLFSEPSQDLTCVDVSMQVEPSSHYTHNEWNLSGELFSQTPEKSDRRGVLSTQNITATSIEPVTFNTNSPSISHISGILVSSAPEPLLDDQSFDLFTPSPSNRNKITSASLFSPEVGSYPVQVCMTPDLFS